MKCFITDSVAAGLICPSSSPVGAGIFFVEKKDGSLRLIGLNDITVKNKYPLHLIDSTFSPHHKATVFTKLDLRIFSWCRMDVPQAGYSSPCPPGLQCSPGDTPLTLLSTQESTTPLPSYNTASGGRPADVKGYPDLHLCLYRLCPEKILPLSLCGPPAAPAHSSTPLVTYRHGFCHWSFPLTQSV